MHGRSDLGPDVVIAGAARTGTSALAAHLRAHPAIDPGATKEPNYFSGEYSRGPDWYDGLFYPRDKALARLDASTSYTYPQFSAALQRLAESSPSATVVYLVRDPVARAISHYLFRRYTLQLEGAVTFGAAIAADSFYTDVSDYAHWLGVIRHAFEAHQVLVVPFDAMRRSSHEVASVVCDRLGLEPPRPASETVDAHRNAVVTFRAKGSRRLIRNLRQSAYYPKVRALVGPARIRRLRSRLVREVKLPTVQEALASCDDAQRAEMASLAERATSAVREYLASQDTRTELGWAALWP